MGIEFESTRTLVAYRADSLVLGSSNGLAFIDGRTGYDDNEVYGDEVPAVAVTPGGDVWAGTNLRGLWHRSRNGWDNLRTAQGLPSNRISAVLVDRSGAVWVGTADAGLARLAPARAARPGTPARK